MCGRFVMFRSLDEYVQELDESPGFSRRYLGPPQSGHGHGHGLAAAHGTTYSLLFQLKVLS